MKTDKALAPFLGRPLIQRVLERVSSLADELIITTNQPECYEFLGIPLVEDLLPGKGASGGLFTALSAARTSLVGVVACDMPFVNTRILRYERKILERKPVAAVIPRTESGTEPFHAIYRREACLPAIQKALDQNHLRVDAWFPDVEIYFLRPEEIQEFDPGQLAFFNLNTPDEFARAENLILTKGEL